MEAKKKALIDLLTNNLNNISGACETLGVSRDTYYKWKKSDPEFKEAAENVIETILDFAEHSLLKQIEVGNTAATIFFLKTKGKHRGYVEKQEVDHTSNGNAVVIPTVQWNFVDASKDKNKKKVPIDPPPTQAKA